MNLFEAFEVHDTLNPKIWTSNNKLLPEVKDKILKIVQTFKEFIEVPIWISDIHLVGSNASYNYHEGSDLDVHIIANYDLIDAPPELLQTVYNTQRVKFKNTYNISVHGVEIELYVEDINTSPITNGIYSVFEDKWIKFPKKITDVPQPDIETEVRLWTELANNAIKSQDIDTISSTIDNIYMLRKNSLATDGEYGRGNLIFKALRTAEVIQNLRDAKDELISKDLSLESLNKPLSEGYLNEDSVARLLGKSKSSAEGSKRFSKRVKSHIRHTPAQYNQIDMNKLFTDGILTVDLEVQGETDTYYVRISYGGFLDILHDQIKRAPEGTEVDLKTITKTLILGFNRGDVYVHCTCDDFCLEGNTKIKLLNGEVISVEEMLKRFNDGESLYVYSTDSLGDFHPGKVEDVWIKGKTSEMIKVTLDNGKEIITTPDHPYMLRNGEYLPAEQLKIGQSLMPLYFRETNGYETVKSNSKKATSYFSVYKTVANDMLSKEIEEASKRTGESIIDIHHKDFNKSNNNPENLYPMGHNEHWLYHANHVKDSGVIEKFWEGGKKYWSTPEARQKQAIQMSDTIKKYWANMSPEEYELKCQERSQFISSNPERLQKQSEIKTNWWNNLTEDEYLSICDKLKDANNRPEVKKVQSQKRKDYWKNISPEERKLRAKKANNASILSIKGKPFSEEHKNKISQSLSNLTPEEKQAKYRLAGLTKIRHQLEKLIQSGKELTQENYNQISYAGCPSINKYFSNIDEAVSYFELNHKIKNIGYLHYDSPIPVYDISVKDYNNFYVDAGVVLHNCHRFSYYATVNNTNSGEAENRRSDITNPDDSLGSGCKHVLLALTNTSWVLKCATVVYNYILYMKQHQEKLYQKILYPAIYGKAYEEKKEPEPEATPEAEQETEEK